MSAWDPDTMSRTTVLAVRRDHLPVDAFPGFHLTVEPIVVDENCAEFAEALRRSFAHIVAPLRVRA